MELTPYIKVGNIAFSEKRSLVRVDYTNFREFKKTPISRNTTDAYPGFHVFYDINNEVEAVEFFHGESLTLNGVNLFSLSKAEFINKFPSCIDEGSSLNCVKEGFMVSFAHNVVDGILVYRKGYWD